MALADAIRTHAGALGIRPVDLATAMSYETGGTFTTNRTANGRIGLIQAGPDEAKQYGFAAGQSPDEQVAAAARYLKDRGVKPGMGRLDVYSTINAGRPGLYDRSDADNGGAPGTVRDKVEGQMGPHRAKAEALLGTGFDTSRFDMVKAPQVAGLLEPTTEPQRPPMQMPAGFAPAAPQVAQGASLPTFAQPQVQNFLADPAVAAALAAGQQQQQGKQLGSAGAGLLAAAQPKTNPGIAQLWQLAMAGGDNVHAPATGRIGLLGV